MVETQLTWEDDDRLVITCTGRIGFDDRESLPRTVADAIGSRPAPQLILDVESVEFVDSAGVGALLVVGKSVAERGGKLVMANVPPHLTELFTTVGLDRLFHLTDTLAEARAYLGEPV